MASKKSYFSDNELIAELKKLGYNDVTPDVFNMMKNDLSVLVERDSISSRKLKNVSSIRYTSTLKQLTSAKDEIPNSNENGSVLNSNDNIKKDLYSKYKSRFNSYGLNIETRSPDHHQSSKIYQGTSVDYKKSIINNITNGNNDEMTADTSNSLPTVKVFPKSQKKDSLASNVSQVVDKSPKDNFVNHKPLGLSKSTSSTSKGCLKKDNHLKSDGKISNEKDINTKPCGLNPISESSNSTSVPKTYHNNDNSTKIAYVQSLGESDKNNPSEIKSNYANQSNCGNDLFSKKDNLKSKSKYHQIALMTSKTKATVEYQGLNLKAKNLTGSTLKPSPEKTTKGAKHQDNSENEKPKGDNSVMSSSKSVSRNCSKPQKKYEQYSEETGSDVKSSLKSRKTAVNDSLTSSGSIVTTKRNDLQVSKHKESSLKGSENVDISNSVLTVSNRKDSPKLPSIEQSSTTKIHSQNVSASSLNSSDGIENHETKSTFSFDSSLEEESQENKFGSSPTYDSSSPEMNDSLPKYRFSTSNRHQPVSPVQNRFSGVSSFDSSLESEDPLEKYRRRFKLNAFSSQENLLGDSSAKIKRKVLRHRNGQSIVTEELLNVPSIFTSSYPSTELGMESSKSFSSDDLSFRTSVVVPEVLRSSYSTPRSIHLRIANQRKKKADPVAMYNYYKKFWNNFKPPGEKSHDKLRWAVRDRMLDYKM